MERRALLNLALTAVVIGLGALIWSDRERPPEDADQPLLFPALADASRLAVLERDPAGGDPPPWKERWVLERRDGAWWLATPFAVPADPVAVADLIEQLGATRSRARYAADALDPTATGLAAPSSALVVTQAGIETRHELGGTESLNYRRYLRSGDAVHLVDDLISYRLLQDGSQLASRKLLPVGARVVKVELPGRVVERGADGRWRVAPDDPSIAADALVALADRWQRAAASAVRKRQDGVVQARIRLTLEGGAAPLELELLTAVDGLRLARRDLGLEYELPESARAELLDLPRAAAVPAVTPGAAAPPST